MQNYLKRKMSNIGKRKVFIASQILVKKYKNFIIFYGNFGALKLKCNIPLNIIQKDKTEFSLLPKASALVNKQFKSSWGTFNINFVKLTYGIANLFYLKLRLIGVGFKIFKKQKKAVLKLGFSHRYFTELPFGSVRIRKIRKRPLVFGLKSFDFELLKNVAVFLRSFKKPEPYKGKGFSLIRERLILKEGKKLKN